MPPSSRRPPCGCICRPIARWVPPSALSRCGLSRAHPIRRPARTVSRRWRDWLLAFGGTFGGVLFRPVGTHPQWGVSAGLALQLVGLAVCVASFLTLGRSFGFVAADQGSCNEVPTRSFAIPFMPPTSCFNFGYVLQSISLRNTLVMVLASGCNIGRALVEDRLLATNEEYRGYRGKVRWRLVPLVW